ncbi:cbb3-type cytochrome c oxidase subunit II [Chryseolinea sp. H1M3-3]|uniref:cytochrome c n=1 Tax=Chryseolinea sp. H1M3-3 TaxID=3034144 RepID=UPI0023EB57B2|nr:cbb3-type cytochrome c oxidase subunit II [Chryseolinea sp. H1M3-3]
MEIFSNHKKLFGVAFLFFAGLSVMVAILPAINNQTNNAPLPGSEALSGDALAGKQIFIANGCVSCHSQQVRNVDMDKGWGPRPSIAADYANNVRMHWWMNTATLMGTERTGPDLTNIGNRLPSADWHLLHLYNPRAVIEESIMPAYPWLFEWKENISISDKVVNLPEGFEGRPDEKLVATKEALALVSYLQSLKQMPLPDGTPAPTFLYEKKSDINTSSKDASELDGALLYANNCLACHQANGEGLKGAFPPLKGSAVVLDDNPEILIDIIMRGYNARDEYAEMPPVGMNSNLKPDEVTAIINHERSSWGNNGKKISVEEVEKIMTFIKTQTPDL